MNRQAPRIASLLVLILLVGDLPPDALSAPGRSSRVSTVEREAPWGSQAMVLSILQIGKPFSIDKRSFTLRAFAAAGLAVLTLSAWRPVPSEMSARVSEFLVQPVSAQSQSRTFLYERPGVRIVFDSVPGSRVQITRDEFEEWSGFLDYVPASHLRLIQRIRYAYSTDVNQDVSWGPDGTVSVYGRPGSYGGPSPSYFVRSLGRHVYNRVLTPEERQEWAELAGGAFFELEYPLWTRKTYFVPINNGLHQLLRDPRDHRLLQRALFMAAVFEGRITIRALPGVLLLGSYDFQMDAQGELVGVDLPPVETRDDSLLRDLPDTRIEFDSTPLPNILRRLLRSGIKAQGADSPARSRPLLSAA